MKLRMFTFPLVTVLLFSGVLSAQERVQPNAKVFIEGSETVDASHADDKATYADFTMAIAAALSKKKVPVVVVTDPEKAEFVIQHTSSHKEDSTGTKVAKIAFGSWRGTSKFEGSFMVISRETSAVVYSYNVKKGNFQSAAESFAKHFKNDHIKKGKSS